MVTGIVDYAMLSPMFPSISKTGYAPDNDLWPHWLKESGQLRNAIALGGVTPVEIPWLQRCGFMGCAMLGYLQENTAQRLRRIEIARNTQYRLQYVTDEPTPEATVAKAIEAVQCGCRWIQVRMKEAPAEAIGGVLTDIRRQAGPDTVLIVDDHVDLASLPEVDGVHLGQTDMPVDDARKILGPDKIIGLTVNTALQAAVAPRADYYGVGPWHMTITKKNPAPVLGADGTAQIIDILHSRGLHAPVVAIGGIVPGDVPHTVAAGTTGVAVSGAIGKAANMAVAVGDFLYLLENKR